MLRAACGFFGWLAVRLLRVALSRSQYFFVINIDEDSSGGDTGCKGLSYKCQVCFTTALSALLLLALLMFRVLCARRLARAAITCDKDTMTTTKGLDVAKPNKHGESYMSGVELVWTERGERLHMNRYCVSLQRSKHLRSKTLCKLCARDHP